MKSAAQQLGGFRMTRQRREVYGALMETPDHPTAVQVFMRAQQRVPGISLATVYNCLESMTKQGVVRQVNFARGPSRFCANKHKHGHFICAGCGRVEDIALTTAAMWRLPKGFTVENFELSLKGTCPDCAAKETV